MCIYYQTRLYDIREEKEMTQKEVANKLHTSRQNYSVWETNTKFIPLNHLNDYCNIFDVSMDYVFKLSNQPSKSKKGVKTLDKKLIGRNLQKLIQTKGITQQILADFLNTTQSTISAYINGKTLILIAFLYQIAKEYNVSMDDICGRK